MDNLIMDFTQQIALLEALACGISDDKIYQEIHKVLQIMDKERMERNRQIKMNTVDKCYLIFMKWLKDSGIKITDAARENVCDALIDGISGKR